MIVVFEFITNNSKGTEYLKGLTSIVNIQVDNFTEVRFSNDCMCINSRTSLDTFLKYDYKEWGIKNFIIQRDKDKNISYFDQYIQEEVLKRFKVLNTVEVTSLKASVYAYKNKYSDIN